MGCFNQNQECIDLAYLEYYRAVCPALFGWMEILVQGLSIDPLIRASSKKL